MLSMLKYILLLSLCIPHGASAQTVVDRSAELETIATEFGLADGPAWDGRGALYVPDVKGEKLFRYSPRQKSMTVVLPASGRISASFFNHGKLFLSDNGESQIAWLQGKQKMRIAGQDKAAKPANRPNDLVVDNQGGIYYTLTRSGQVIYIAPDGMQSIAVEKIETPNGLILSPDEQTLYVAAYVPKQIWAYAITKPGTVGKARLLAEMDAGPDKGADGMTTDRAGNVYCAGPAHVWIWSPGGRLLDKIATPTRPINCAFGDSDMRSLYITGFGGLYRQRMTISGRSPQPPSTAESQRTGDTRPSTAIPTNVKAHLDVVYAQYGERKMLADIFVPTEGTQPHPAIVVVHGGGWLNGDKTKFRALALELAARGYVTMAIEYRLGGEARFPAGIHDCNASVRFLRAQARQYGVDGDRIGAVGGSAGGHLVGLMATGSHVAELQGAGGHSTKSSKLQAAIVMAGPMQMVTGSVADRSRKMPQVSNSNKWLGKTIDEAPELYKLADAYEHISADSTPILFMVGEHDNPQRNQPSRDRLQSVGVPTGLKVYEAGKHGCWNSLPWFNDMVRDMDVYFQQHLRTKG